MFSSVFRAAVGGRSFILRNKPLQSYQLASLFSSDGIISPEQPESPEKIVKPESSKLRTRLSLRRQTLPPYPDIEIIRKLNVERFLPSNFKTVQYGDYEFQVCLENYVQIYTSGYQMPRPPGACSGYAVYYAKDHPLNESGPVERRQAILHAKIYGPLRALQSIPHGLFTKVSLNTDDIMVTKFIARHLKNMSENSFRSTYTGKLNKDLETNMEVNKLLRTRQDLTFRVQYTPNDITFPPAVYANKMAMNAANDAQNNRLRHHKCETCEEF